MLIAAKQWVDHQCYCCKYLVLKDNTIAVNSLKYIGAAVFASYNLNNEKCSFKIGLAKIDTLVGVGVVDEQYKLRK